MEADSVKGIPVRVTHHHSLISLIIIMITGIMGMVIGTATLITPIRYYIYRMLEKVR
jgi:hypothetical protein